jgi:hypothetical protein
MNSIILESAKGVKGGKVQLTFSQIVKTPTTSSNVLGILNASDDRFNQQKPRYAWLSAQPEDIKKQFELDLNLAEGEEIQLDIVDPRLASNPSASLNILIVETTDGSDYDVRNFETRAKRAGKDGDFIMKDGKYIYVNTIVVDRPVSENDHKIFKDTTRVPASGDAKSMISDALGQ